MKYDIAEFWDVLMERHLPIPFLDYNSLQQVKKILIARENPGRKEVLILAYLLGADVEESNRLLQMLGHSPLYAKRREDAIWLYALTHRLDCISVIDEIFLQNADENIIET